MKAFITASGAQLPQTVVGNGQLAEQLGLTAEQIFKSSGIRERRWASRGETTSLLSVEALKKAGAVLDEIDYLMLGTMTADRFIPGSAPMVQTALGLREIPCRELVQMMKKAADFYRDATLPMGDGEQSPADFARQQSASTGLPEHMCKGNMSKNHFVLSNMDRILDCLTRGLDLEILTRGYGMESRGVIVSYQAQSPGDWDQWAS